LFKFFRYLLHSCAKQQFFARTSKTIDKLSFYTHFCRPNTFVILVIFQSFEIKFKTYFVFFSEIFFQKYKTIVKFAKRIHVLGQTYWNIVVCMLYG